MRYSAFISYNDRDVAWAKWLHRELERYRLPRYLAGRSSPMGPIGRRLPPVFRDRDELSASADLAQSVRDALSEAASLIIICSPNGARSRWVNEEVKTYIALGRRARIQCLLVPDPATGKAPADLSTVFPPTLLENGVEPLAADASRSGDSRRGATLKLVAGMLGVGYDELRRRDLVRRQRRLAAVAVASLAGLVLTTGLAAFALLARGEAIRQRDLARQKTIAAERTTGFVKGLFTISDPSEAKGAKVTALQILDRGADQITGSLNDEPDVKAELSATLSEVYQGLGFYHRADALVKRSILLPVSDPLTRARQFATLAESQARQSDYTAAMQAYDRALASASLADPRDATELTTRILIGRAEALASTDAFSRADRDIAQAYRLDGAKDGPRSSAVARDLETAGLSHNLAGTFEASQRFYERALAIRLATQGRLHPRVSEDLNELGTLAYLQHDSVAAEYYWRQTLATDQRVLGPDHPDLAATLNSLGRVMVERREFRKALAMLDRAVAINLRQRAETYDDFAFIFANRAIAKRGLGDLTGASDDLRKAMRAAVLHKHRNLAPIMVDLAEIRCTRGDTAEGLALLDRAMPIMARTYPDDPWRTAWVTNTRGYCLLRKGDHSGAAQAIRASAPVLDRRWDKGSVYWRIVAARIAAL